MAKVSFLTLAAAALFGREAEAFLGGAIANPELRSRAAAFASFPANGGGGLAAASAAASTAASAASAPYFADPVESTSPSDARDNNSNSEKTVLIAGATGYIGRAVVRECVSRGYDTVALVRDAQYVLETEEGRRKYAEPFEGARVMTADVEDAEGLRKLFGDIKEEGAKEGSGSGSGRVVDCVISCLASPLGTKREAEAIDYQATLNCLNAGRDPAVSARHFVLLSAFCVRKPLLELQRQKLRFEAQLTAQTDMTYSIVRPTAFFKSVSGQLEGIQSGAPYVLFGDGAVTRCNPIAEEELAEYMMDCLLPETGRTNKILNVGGPDEPLTNKMLGEMMYKSTNLPPKFVYAPTFIFDYIIDAFQWLADVTGSERWADAAETGRIGKYYAVEDMLTTDPEEMYGKIKMQDHYDRIAARGQDPFTPVRATAVIGKVLEALPAAGAVSLPIGWAALNPDAVGAAVNAYAVAASKSEGAAGAGGGSVLDLTVSLASILGGSQ
uniref:NmrA-like domain-containing protein n=1 Tax=Trieres chinensis TaxID=1514140 RepID=A0A7S1ZLI8_TRICV|mmetsp:Transcript_28354/g.57982  ORF Transcript_28354/g.57982 Transcript_28354/m.57982 type:complete len:498 (+) Transcript_28354:193-1686(+)